MSKVDWSLAPEGATHYGVVAENRICWYAVKSEHHYDYAYQSDGYHAEKWAPSVGAPGHRPLIERPKPVTWSGPQDGLPPIGTVCEALCTYMIGCRWSEATIKYISDKHVVLVDSDNSEVVFKPQHLNFRALKTAEQLAADSRESAIRELMDIAQVDCRVTAARLVDAGFKREVK